MSGFIGLPLCAGDVGNKLCKFGISGSNNTLHYVANIQLIVRIRTNECHRVKTTQNDNAIWACDVLSREGDSWELSSGAELEYLLRSWRVPELQARLIWP